MHLPKTLPRLLCSALVVAGLAGLAGHAAAADNLVLNGGFETGDFSNWTLVGDTTFAGVQCGALGSVPELFCDGFFGPIGATGGILQAIPVPAAGQYLINFIFRSDGSPGTFRADMGASNLLTLSDPAAGTTSYSFTRMLTAGNTALIFQFRDDTGFMELDGVQVTAVPEPASLVLMGLGVAALGARRMRKPG
jgi:hypothetical protein